MQGIYFKKKKIASCEPVTTVVHNIAKNELCESLNEGSGMGGGGGHELDAVLLQGALHQTRK